MCHSQTNLPTYFVSYATEAGQHSFIIISKEVNVDGVNKKLVLASFGLYGQGDCYETHIASCGLISDLGRIRSDHFILENINNFGSEYGVGVKNYSITANQAMQVLKKVKEDSQINAAKKEKDDKAELRYLDETILLNLTDEEWEYYQFFRFELNKNMRGGPQFNGRDFNCHKYAIFILRMLGICDLVIESCRYPLALNHPYLQKACIDSNGNLWDKTTQIDTIPKQSIVYPQCYKQIFYQHENPIEGALALLKDYAENSLFNKLFHFKRHYKKQINAAVEHIKNNSSQFNTLNKIIEFVKTCLPEHHDMVGSIHKRINFLEEQAMLSPMQRTKLFIEANPPDKPMWDVESRMTCRC